MIVARGGHRGKTAGRGTKGQKARSGHKIRPEIRDLIKRIPKLRGRGKNSNLSIQGKPVALNLEALELIFSNGDVVSRKSLYEGGLITMQNGKIPEVKILGNGNLTKKLTVKGLVVSASAKEKIEKAGGAIS
ncbi:MAG: ribosomal protein large subunit ribosomal protein [Candidatus Paceibacter sp.]|nr:ribosomal protein large subunit ribosomal protein [Candidatus Paceibacter sp.]